MERDLIIEEIHAIREAFAKDHDYDLAAMWRTLVRHQQESGRRVVSFAPRRLSTDALSPAPGSSTAQQGNAADEPQASPAPRR
jgi:hypothetical protein